MACPGPQRGAGRCHACVSAAQACHLSLWAARAGVRVLLGPQCLVGRETALGQGILVGRVSAFPGSAKFSFGPAQPSL